jgi:hypothetical protein
MILSFFGTGPGRYLNIVMLVGSVVLTVPALIIATIDLRRLKRQQDRKHE